MTRPAPSRPLLLLMGGAIACAAFRIGQSRAKTALSRNEAERTRLRVLDLAHSRDDAPEIVIQRAQTYLDFVGGLTALQSWLRAAVTPKGRRHED